jgi:hypothetical protein
MSYLNGVLVLTAETAELPAECFNEYALSMRGRATQGVNLFKQQILALSAESKRRSQKFTDEQKKMNFLRAFSLHSALSEKSIQYCIALQNEINSDEGQIF